MIDQALLTISSPKFICILVNNVIIKYLWEVLIMMDVRWDKSLLELNHCLMLPLLIWGIRCLCTKNDLLLMIWLKHLRIISLIILLLDFHLDTAFVYSWSTTSKKSSACGRLLLNNLIKVIIIVVREMIMKHRRRRTSYMWVINYSPAYDCCRLSQNMRMNCTSSLLWSLITRNISMLGGKSLVCRSPLILKMIHIAAVNAITQHHLILLVLHLYLRLIIAELLKEFKLLLSRQVLRKQ